ncbi:hypothetical protein QUC31_000144 [Theobroma cacao]|uniref:RBR-type E3 ubiquitin transferase n=1 Tax=Theobroma cacao TaxID=3641 RepID=A0AB32WNN5_THECC|nr:PREDICTED: probable E3 ubiquitin-protein ligase ARI8 [Theobroma cacao]XP_017981407.1 PREDICTED: probable E3 ubiquitin-protein ligase ARI8 [Theobroma cacao]XP_017981408.1 PREDICTED: probable E3 ubiquitin-protein ligase ARI8 [Theobroma cacao]WRX30568.1 zinc finger protein [Theobroma cacao]
MSGSEDDNNLGNDDGDYYFCNAEDTEDDDEGIALQEDETDNLPRSHQNYTVLKEADIRHRMEDSIGEVSGVLSISKVEASILLLHYNWSVGKVHDSWFTDEGEARKKAGLVVKPLIELPDHGDILCRICFESYSRDGIKSTVCGHPYCSDCWSSYIKTAIADGPGSLLLKCPEPSCRAAVGEDMIGVFASEEEKKKYSGYFVMSYIEDSKMIKWCPGPGCENAINFDAGSTNFDVSCACSHLFCWNCSEEAHRPVDCETVRKWIMKNSSEAENVNYILAFTKPCPKCRRPIEKNMGCSHMSCMAPCYYQFCWLCLKDWSNHGACNRYNQDPEEERREKAKKYMMRYSHYFERWATNQKSMKKAAADMENVQSNQLEILARIQLLPETQFSFLTEAWQQIVECRRVLAWTYAYGYYLPDQDPAKRNLFEYLQGQAESGLERLHDCAEKELRPFLKDQHPENEFIDFRKRLSVLTTVTRNYFDNLVTALENGLSDVKSQNSSSVSKKPRRESTMNTADAADVVAGAQILTTHIKASFSEGPWVCPYCSYRNNGSATSCGMCARRGTWACDHCTFANTRTATTCFMCLEPRQP